MKISIIIASGAGGEFLSKCLDSLRNQALAYEAEIIVVDRCGGEVVSRIKRDYPFVTLLEYHMKHRLSVPELRSIGVQYAHGDIVAIIEEHCIAASNWIEVIFSSFLEDDAAIGGPIMDNNYPRLSDWVVYFSEYHNFLPPWSNGCRYMLNGANIAYNRLKLLLYKNVLNSGYWEVVLHPLLAKEGKFRSIANMMVYHNGPFNYGYYLRQRYLLSRVWGGTQRNKISFVKRIIYILLAPVLPFFILARITQRVFNSKQLIRKYIPTIPLLIPTLVAYTFGEWIGYLVGMGNALELVE